MRVDPQQQRVVVQHLLEMRYHPSIVDAVAGEPAGELVIHSAAGHRRAGRRTASSACGEPVRSQCRSSASSNADGGNFGAPPNPPCAVSSSRRTAATAWSQSAGSTCGPATGQSGSHRAQFAGDLVGRLLDLAAAIAPGLGDRRKQLQKAGFRIVGAAEERPAVGRQETRHGPAALPGERDGGVHVDRVDVGPLLAIHLDAHEPGVHRRGDLVVFERLVRHHVTPVAGGVADRQQDRHVALPRPRPAPRGDHCCQCTGLSACWRR